MTPTHDPYPELSAHWHTIAETWPTEVRARHQRLSSALVAEGFDEPTAGYLAAQRVVAEAPPTTTADHPVYAFNAAGDYCDRCDTAIGPSPAAELLVTITTGQQRCQWPIHRLCTSCSDSLGEWMLGDQAPVDVGALPADWSPPSDWPPSALRSAEVEDFVPRGAPIR